MSEDHMDSQSQPSPTSVPSPVTLSALLARVEAIPAPPTDWRDREANIPFREIDAALDALAPLQEERECWCTGACRPDNTSWAGACVCVPRYTASLDAALALVERCLPGWGSGSEHLPPQRPWGFIANGGVFVAGSHAETRSLALLAVLLKALGQHGTTERSLEPRESHENSPSSRPEAQQGER